jgi:hypothetical protein
MLAILIIRSVPNPFFRLAPRFEVAHRKRDSPPRAIFLLLLSLSIMGIYFPFSLFIRLLCEILLDLKGDLFPIESFRVALLRNLQAEAKRESGSAQSYNHLHSLISQ